MYQGPRFKGKSVYLAFLEIFTGFVIHAIYTESNLCHLLFVGEGREEGSPIPPIKKLLV